jgi:hypothetical protein
MKNPSDTRRFPWQIPLTKSNEILLNRLCLSCRRTCKQAAVAVVPECKRYYHVGPCGAHKEWKQINLTLK